MKKIIYYNWTKGNISDEFGDPISWIPSISFGEKPQWELVILEEEGGKVKESNLSSIGFFRAALDVDFSSSTEVMCRTLPENITSSGNRITLTLDANTETFLAAVDGKQSVNAFFEISGFDSDSAPIFHLLIPVTACMMLDPLLPEDLPPNIAENYWAEKGYVDAAIRKLDADEDGIADKAKEAEYAASAGYANSAGSAASIPWGGITEKPETFPPDPALLSDALLSGGSAGQVLTHSGTALGWQDITLSSGGEGDPAAVAATLVTSLNEAGYMVVSGMPVEIQSPGGNIYPVSGGFVTSSADGFLIDPAPYLLADGQAGFTGSWTIYTLNVEDV